MLVKKNESYSRVELLPNGKVVRFYSYEYLNICLCEGTIIIDVYDSVRALLVDGGFTFLPPSLETLSVGDFVKDTDGNKRKVLTAQGCGEDRAYHLANADGTASEILDTANELKNIGYVPLPWEGAARTAEDVLAELPEADRKLIQDKMK